MLTVKTLRKIVLFLLCAAMLLACLAGCGRREENTPPSGSEQPTPGTEPQPKPDPREVLAAAFQSSMDDLKARYDASRLSSLVELLDSPNLTVEFSAPAQEGDISLSGTLVTDAGAGMADLSLTLPELDLDALLHYDSEFLGIRCEGVFGDGRFYGLRPYGLREQLEGSALASMLKIDMDVVAQLDETINSLPKPDRTPSGPVFDAFVTSSLELINGLDLSVDKESYSSVLPAGELAGFLRKLAENCPVLGDLYASLGGTKSLDEVIGAIESGGADTTLTFTVSGDRVRHISARYDKPGGTVDLEAELYGETGDLLRVTVEPYFNLELSVGGDEHLSMHIVDSETVKLDWTASGSLDFIAYANDITDLALEGTMTLFDGKLIYEGTWTSGNAGAQNPLTLSCVSGGEPSVPQDTALLTELTEREIFRIITRTVIGML